MHGLTGAGPGYRLVLLSNQAAADSDAGPDPYGPPPASAGPGGSGPAAAAAGASGPRRLAGGGASVHNPSATLRCESDSGSDQESLADSLAGSALDPQDPSPAASDIDPGDQYRVTISVNMLYNLNQYCSILFNISLYIMFNFMHNFDQFFIFIGLNVMHNFVQFDTIRPEKLKRFLYTINMSTIRSIYF